MSAEELKLYFREQLVPQRSILQELDVFDTLVDFISQSVTNGIPAWTALLTFNDDGTGDGAFTTHPGDTGTLRFWKSKVAANINHAPPTSSIVFEDAYWIEVSPSTGSAIKEWAPGIFGTGLIIVFYDLTGTDPALYKLNDPVRPYHSENFTTELAAGKWQKLSGAPVGAAVYIEDAFDASTATGSDGDYPEPPLGTGPSGKIMRGNIFDVGVASPVVSGDIKFPVGSMLRALIDEPGQDDANWRITF